MDGHDVEALVKAFHMAANTKGKPTALIAKTYKGHGFPGMLNYDQIDECPPLKSGYK